MNNMNIFNASEWNETIKLYFDDCKQYLQNDDMYNAFDRACEVLLVKDKSNGRVEDWHDMYGTELVSDEWWNEFDSFLNVWINRFAMLLGAKCYYWEILRKHYDASVED